MEDTTVIDLVGMEARRRRAEAKFTVLRSTDGRGWTEEEVGRLVNGLGPMPIIHGPLNHPQVLLIREEYAEAKCSALLPNRQFEHSIITGFDNPDLPFPPPPL